MVLIKIFVVHLVLCSPIILFNLMKSMYISKFLHITDQRGAQESNIILRLQGIIVLLNSTLTKPTTTGITTEGKQFMLGSTTVKEDYNSTLKTTTVSGNVTGGKQDLLGSTIKDGSNSTLTKTTTSGNAMEGKILSFSIN